MFDGGYDPFWVGHADNPFWGGCEDDPFWGGCEDDPFWGGYKSPLKDDERRLGDFFRSDFFWSFFADDSVSDDSPLRPLAFFIHLPKLIPPNRPPIDPFLSYISEELDPDLDLLKSEGVFASPSSFASSKLSPKFFRDLNFPDLDKVGTSLRLAFIIRPLSVAFGEPVGELVAESLEDVLDT